MAQSHLVMEDSQLQRGEISALTSAMEGTKSFSHAQNGPALISDLLVRMAQSHLMMEDSQLTKRREISALTSAMEGTKSSHHDGMAQPLHLTMEGTIPLTMSEWL